MIFVAEDLSIQLPSIPVSPVGCALSATGIDRNIKRLDKENRSQCCRWSVIALAAEWGNPKSVACRGRRGEAGGGRCAAMTLADGYNLICGSSPLG